MWTVKVDIVLLKCTNGKLFVGIPLHVGKKYNALFKKRKAAVCKNKRLSSNKCPPLLPTSFTSKYENLINVPHVY